MPANTNGKKQKKFTRRTRKMVRARARNNGAQMRGAPAGISQDLQQSVRFSGDRRDGIKMHVCVPISNLLGVAPDSGSGGALHTGTTSSLNGNLSQQLNLTDPQGLRTVAFEGTAAVFSAPFISPIFDLIASAFVRYRVSKLRFDYEPQASSTAEGRLVFAFANDPSHPILWSDKAPVSSDLLSMSDSIAFAPWRSWSMDVTTRLQSTKYYTYASNSGLNSSEDRFSDFGVISCVSSTRSTSSRPVAISGILYMSIELTLEEFCPISVVRPSMAMRLSKKLIGGHLNATVPHAPVRGVVETIRKDPSTLADTVVETAINGLRDQALEDQALIDYHLSMQAKVPGPVLGDAYRNWKHRSDEVSSDSPRSPVSTEQKPSSEEVAATMKLTASSIEISKLKSQLDQLKHSKTS